MLILPQAISDSDTTIAVTPDPTLPQDDGVLQIEDEQITYSTLYMGTLYGCTRGANSTTAAPHAAGVPVTIANFYQAATPTGITFPILAPSGSPAATSYDFIDLPGTGISVNVNYAIMSVGGSDMMDFVPNTYISANVPILLQPGDPTAPGVGFGGGFASGLYQNSPTSLGLSAGSVPALLVDNDISAGNTRLYVWDVDTNGFQKVSVGAPDSGGTGFKLLRIPN